MLIVIDNYDSFAHNLARYVRTWARARCRAERCGDRRQIRELDPHAIVMSPGPGTPTAAGNCVRSCATAGGTADPGRMPGPSNDRRGLGRKDRPRNTSPCTAGRRGLSIRDAVCFNVCPIRVALADTIRWWWIPPYPSNSPRRLGAMTAL